MRELMTLSQDRAKSKYDAIAKKEGSEEIEDDESCTTKTWR
jgi:hypothetical protein